MPPRRSREVAVAVSGLALVVVLSAAVTVLSPPASDGLGAGSSFSLGSGRLGGGLRDASVARL